jgi:uncharacterized protein
VIYLLDVNALLALGYAKHIHHARVRAWLSWCKQLYGENDVTLATCAITELGFIRVVSGKSRLAESLADARAALRCVKASQQFIFLRDGLDAERLPEWVTKSAQTTDGHLLMLSTAHHAWFATLDERIPGAELIPEYLGSVLPIREPTELHEHAWR